MIVRIYDVFFLQNKNKGRILFIIIPKEMVQLLVKFFDYILVKIFSNVMIAQKIFRWWAQMAEDNLFHDILIIGTSSWDYEDNFDPISRKKILISRKNLHFLCLSKYFIFSPWNQIFFQYRLLFVAKFFEQKCTLLNDGLKLVLLFLNIILCFKKINNFFRWMVG